MRSETLLKEVNGTKNIQTVDHITSPINIHITNKCRDIRRASMSKTNFEKYENAPLHSEVQSNSQSYSTGTFR